MMLASSVAAPKASAPLRARRRSSVDPPTVRGRCIVVRCASEPTTPRTTDDRGRSRRDALLSLASLGAVPALIPARSASANVASIYKYEPVDALPPAIADSGNAKVPIAAALRAQTVYAGYAVPIIEKNVTAPLGTLISLAARDAGTFDASANTGGLNGSIRFELDRPENKRFLNAIEQLADAKKEIDAKCSQPIGWADLIALAPAGKARYAFLRDFCGYTDRFEPRWQYKAGDITKIGCDVDGVMLRAPYGSSPEQIEATSWFRQNYASTGPLTGARVHMGRADATAADQPGLVPTEGATAGEYIEWFARMRLSLPALVNLAPYVDDTCEATLRACPDCAGLFRELDTKNYQPGNLEKPLIKSFREMTLRGPAAFADPMRYVNDDGTPAIPEVNGRRVVNVKQLMDGYVDPYPVWIL